MDVRQRQYEIARKGTTTSTLTTGYLSSCFAVYGWNEGKGVGFLWHMDAHVPGLELVAKDLESDIGKDLSGFKVYMTSGYGLYLRVFAVILACVGSLVAPWFGASPCSALVGGLVVIQWALWYFLRNWYLLRRDVKLLFGVSCEFQHASFGQRGAYAKKLVRAILARRLDMLGILQLPRAAVTIHADRRPDPPVLEVGDEDPSSAERFGPTCDSSPSKLPTRVAEARDRGAIWLRDGNGWYWTYICLGSPLFAGSLAYIYVVKLDFGALVLLLTGSFLAGGGVRGLRRNGARKKNANAKVISDTLARE